jgi:hypothetical protein
MDMGRLACISAIVTISNPTKLDARNAMRCGAHAVVTRPFSQQALHRRVQWVLQDARKMQLAGEQFIIEGNKIPRDKIQAPKEDKKNPDAADEGKTTKTAAA